MSKCQCLQDDEQSDPKNTTEQFCGYQKDGIYYACSKGCGQCSDKDPKKCNQGCPVLNQPAKPSSDRGSPPSAVAKKKKPKKPDTPPKTRWWIWPLILLVILIVMGGLIFIVGTPKTNTSAPTAASVSPS